MPAAVHRAQSLLVLVHLTFARWQASQDSRSFLVGVIRTGYDLASLEALESDGRYMDDIDLPGII